MLFARLLPCAARCSSRPFLTDTRAISDRAKKPFNKVRTIMIIISKSFAVNYIKDNSLYHIGFKKFNLYVAVLEIAF